MAASGLFVGIARAIYAYAAQTPDELSIDEDHVVYVIEKGDDDWWKVKRKPAPGQDEGPSGLVPSNYLEQIPPLSKAITLYEYNRQTDEEISFPEDVHVDVFDKDDPDWYFVHHEGEYGFAPSNYLEETAADRICSPELSPAQEQHDDEYPDYTHDPTRNSVLTPQREPPVSAPPLPAPPQLPLNILSRSTDSRQHRPASPEHAIPNAYSNPQDHYAVRRSEDSSVFPSPTIPKGVKTWPVQEIHKKNKKRKATLGLGSNTIIIATKDDGDGLQQWPITSIIEYSSERKHVFIDLAAPPRSASFDFHAGSKEIAEQIVSAIGEMVGAVRAPGLREIAAAIGSPMEPLPESSALAHRNQTFKKGIMLYDFAAQGDDELSVKAEQEVVILDDYSNEDWWKCRIGKREGVIPSSYIEVKTKLAKAAKKDAEVSRNRESLVWGPRSSTLEDSQQSQKPDLTKVREWTDRTRSFKVEAQFMGCTDGKIHLHKTNGVKIAVPVQKMSIDDINFVERVTGKSLKEDKPLSDVKREQATSEQASEQTTSEQTTSKVQNNSNFDWFEFFLACEIDHNACQRYTTNFEKDDIDESLIPDLTADVLRTLGVKEGHILRIMRYIEAKHGKRKASRNIKTDEEYARQVQADERRNRPVGDERKFKDSLQSVLTIEPTNKTAQPLFSNGPDGTLRNNTRKGRPQQTRSVSDTVDPNAFKQNVGSDLPDRIISSAGAVATSGFDDDAWIPKPAQSPRSIQIVTPAPVSSSTNLNDLITLESVPSQNLSPGYVSPQGNAAGPPVAFHPYPLGQSQIVPKSQPQYNAVLYQPPHQGNMAMQADPNTGNAQFAVARSRPTCALNSQNVNSLTLNVRQPQFTVNPLPQPSSNVRQPVPQFTVNPQPQPSSNVQPQFTGQVNPPSPNFMTANQSQNQFNIQPAADLAQRMQQHFTGLQQGQNYTSPASMLPQPPMSAGFVGYASSQHQMAGFQPSQNSQVRSFLGPPTMNQPLTVHRTGPATFNQQPSSMLSHSPIIHQSTGYQPEFRPVLFGAPVQKAMPTGQRANLAAATPENPFGLT